MIFILIVNQILLSNIIIFDKTSFKSGFEILENHNKNHFLLQSKMSWESLNYISDIIVVVENKEYHLHKAYLVNIPYFETIIKGNYYTNNRIIMDEIVKKEPFESIMNDIYNVYRKIFDYSGVLKHNVTYIDNITESIEKLILLRYYNLTSIEEILLNYFSKEIMCSEKYPTYEELDRLYEIGYLLENDISSQDKEINYCLGYDISLKYKIIPTRYLNLVIEVLSLRASNGRKNMAILMTDMEK